MLLGSYALACVVVFSIIPASARAQEPKQAKPVVVARVIQASVKSGRRFVGSVKPLRTSTIGSAVEGRVESFLVNQGDRVAEGQVLAQLRTETLEISLAAGEAELELYRQQLAELENGSRPEDIAEADANMRRAKAAVKNAEAKLVRIQSLVTTRTASEAELEDAREQAEATRFALKAAEALLKRLETGPRQESIAQAHARVELQKQRRNLLKDRHCQVHNPGAVRRVCVSGVYGSRGLGQCRRSYCPGDSIG